MFDQAELIERVRADNPAMADLLTSNETIMAMVKDWLGFVMGLPKPAREQLMKAFIDQLAGIELEAPQ